MEMTQLEENDDWVIHIQEFPTCIYWHIRVKRWSVGVYRRMLITLYNYVEKWPDRVHAAPYVSKQQAKFMQMLGFEWHGDVVATVDNEMINIWRLP